MSYSKVYKNIDKRTIEATKKLIKSGLWKTDMSEEHKIEICKTWVEEVSKIYKVEVPIFRFKNSEAKYRSTGGGCYYYYPVNSEIFLYKKFSLVTLLHEFRHHVQYSKEIKMYKNDKEEDARAWSVSLFKLAAPKSFANAVEKGILHFS